MPPKKSSKGHSQDESTRGKQHAQKSKTDTSRAQGSKGHRDDDNPLNPVVSVAALPATEPKSFYGSSSSSISGSKGQHQNSCKGLAESACGGLPTTATGMGMGVALRTIRSDPPVADVSPFRVNLNMPPPNLDPSSSNTSNVRAGEEIRRILGVGGRLGGTTAGMPPMALHTQYHYQNSLTPPPPSMHKHATLVPSFHVDSRPPLTISVGGSNLAPPPPVIGMYPPPPHFQPPPHGQGMWHVAPPVAQSGRAAVPPHRPPPLYDAWGFEHSSHSSGDNANVDDLLDLIEEFWSTMDEASLNGSPVTGKGTRQDQTQSSEGGDLGLFNGNGYEAGRYTQYVSDASANWGDSNTHAQAGRLWVGSSLPASGSGGGSPIPEQFAFTLDGLLAGLTTKCASPSGSSRGSIKTSPPSPALTPRTCEGRDDVAADDSSPPQSVPRTEAREHHHPRAQHTLPDVVATVDGIKNLILAPHTPERPLSLLAHRIGPTLLLEGTGSLGLETPEMSIDEARKKALRSRLLYYSVLVSPPSREPMPDNQKSTSEAEGEPREAEANGDEEGRAGKSIFRKTMQWNLSDMNILIGATQPTLRDPSSNQEVNLQVYDINEIKMPKAMPSLAAAASPPVSVRETVPADSHVPSASATTVAETVLSPVVVKSPLTANKDSHGAGSACAPIVGTTADTPKLDRSSALEYWLDNILSNVASVALCYHRDGDVQGYQVVPTHNLPQMSDPAFSPVAVQTSSTQVLKWLQQGTSTGGTSFVVVKDANSSELKLYDITGLSSGGVREMLRHPDSRSKRRVTGPAAEVKREIGKSEGGAKESPEEARAQDESAAVPLDSVTGALVPVSCYEKESSLAIATGDRARGTAALTSFIRGCKAALGGGATSEASIPSSAAFKHLKYPYAMMCFRMAQCLPPFSKDAFKMWEHVAALLTVREEEALFPLATAHVALMEYHAGGYSQLPNADRHAITHASRAVQALHILDRCVKQAVLPHSVLEGTSAFGEAFIVDKEGKKKASAKRSPEAMFVKEEDLAQLLEEALEGDPDVTQTVEQMRGLCVRVVNCMLTMGERELVRGKSLANGEAHVDGYVDDIDDPKMGVGSVAFPAIVLGRVVENILVAQAALMLRAFEVPSGLIMANPDLVISSDVSSHQLSTTNTTGRPMHTSAYTPSLASLSHRRAASVATATTLDSTVAPSPALTNHSTSRGVPSISTQQQMSKREQTVLQCFERIATLSGDVVSTHLKHVLENATADAEAQKSSTGEIHTTSHGTPPPSSINPNETCLHRYITKLNRDLKVTFSVLEGIASSASSLGTDAPPASSIIGATVPDHVNFVGRMTPLDANPITSAETAMSLYQQAVGHRHALQVSNQHHSKLQQAAQNKSKPIPPFYSPNALSRKIAAIHAVVAEFYARGLASHLVPKDGAAMSPSSLMNESTASMASVSSPTTCINTIGHVSSPFVSADNAIMGPLRDSREAYVNFDRAATAFINCKDFANAALNLLNASKMCLRAGQALSGLKDLRQMSFSHADAKRREAAEVEDNAAIEEEHGRAIAALDKAEQLPKGGDAGITASIIDNVRQFAFSVYIYAFQWEMKQLARSALSNASFSSASSISSASSAPLPVITESTLSRLHDRYLAPALKIPKKLAHLMPSETQRAMEAKVLSFMISLYWLAYTSPTSSSASPSVNMSMPDRVLCVRFAKKRLRQFWKGYLRGSLSTNSNVALSLWTEATRVVNQMIACDLFLFTHGNGTGSAEGPATVAASSEAVFNEKVQCVEHAFTTIVDWRLWLRMAVQGLVVVPPTDAASAPAAPHSQQPTAQNRGTAGGSAKKKGGKQSSTNKGDVSTVEKEDVRAELVVLAEAALPIAKHLTMTLICLLKLIKEQGAAPTIVTTAASVNENIKRSLAVSTRDSVAVSAANGGDSDKSRLEWLSQFVNCVDEAEKIFNGRRSK